MRTRALLAVFASALMVPLLVNSFAVAAETVPTPASVDSGPHSYQGVTEGTTTLRTQFPLLNASSNQISKQQLTYGGPDIVTDEASAGYIDK